VKVTCRRTVGSSRPQTDVKRRRFLLALGAGVRLRSGRAQASQRRGADARRRAEEKSSGYRETDHVATTTPRRASDGATAMLTRKSEVTPSRRASRAAPARPRR